MVQIDMEMPKTCNDCPIFYDFLDCPITETSASEQGIDCFEERMNNCPLIEIKAK